MSLYFIFLIKESIYLKITENPTCIDLILTNKPRNFMHSKTIETGLSDFHKLTVTVLTTSFRKIPAKIVLYRDKKEFSSANFHCELSTIDLYNTSNDQFVSEVMEILNYHLPLKKRYVRSNDCPFITKSIRKEHMKRTQLRNKYLRNRTDANATAFKQQRNKCVSLLKKVKKNLF